MYFDDIKVTVDEHPIIQADDYYPLGLTFNSYQRVTSEKNKYLYNGKEVQDALDLNWLDNGARMYMADIGRWGVVDPKADKYVPISPYNYALNNPILFVDPDGEEVKPKNEAAYKAILKLLLPKMLLMSNWTKTE